jgi:hypothetical protein
VPPPHVTVTLCASAAHEPEANLFFVSFVRAGSDVPGNWALRQAVSATEADARGQPPDRGIGLIGASLCRLCGLRYSRRALSGDGTPANEWAASVG